MNRLASCLSILAALTALVGCSEPLPVQVAANPERAKTYRGLLEADAGTATTAEKPALVEPTGWATLTGTFKVVGNAPAPTPLVVDKDQATCGPGATSDLAKDILVGSGGGLANVLVMLTTSIPADDPKWEHESYLAAKDAVLQTPFDQKQCVFLTRVFPLRSTQTVPVLNSDNVGHNANIQASGGATPKNFSLSPGQSVDYKPGGESQTPFQVTCTIHGWMKAWMISRNNPYYAVTAPDGAFQIANLPAAEGLKLKFRAWQERANFIQDVTVNGQPAKWRRGEFEIELKPGESTNMEIVVDASIFK